MASLTTIRPGDMVEVDVKGRRAFALVQDKEGRELVIRPFYPQTFTWQRVTGHQVVKHWRLTKNTRKVTEPSGQHAE